MKRSLFLGRKGCEPLADAINIQNLFTWVARALVLFTAMPVHECAHGLVADRLGDDTPRNQGRLSLNPFVHLDLFGGLLLIFAGFGWAKPVQVDPRRFRHPRRGMALTALAGPLSNILLALVVMVAYKALGNVLPVFRNTVWAYAIFVLLEVLVVTNLRLAVFNLLPVPPLDGAKIFGIVLPDKYYFTVMRYERYIAFALIALLLFTDVLHRPLFFLTEQLINLLDLVTFPLGRLG